MIAQIKIVCFYLLFANLFISASAQKKQPVAYADPLMGTSESRWMLNPGASMPFGMVQLSPDNQSDGWKTGYEYTISSISGFSHIHSWTMGGLSVMPTTGIINPRIYPASEPTTTGATAGHRSRIDKRTEHATPGYYSVELLNYKIKAEITSTTRCGFFRLTFTESKESNVLFNLLFPSEYPFKVLDAKITKVSDTEIEGFSQQSSAGFNDYTVYFVARFNKAFKLFGGWEGNKMKKDTPEVTGNGDVGAYVRFETKGGEKVLLKTAISLVSIANARLNMDTELKPFGWNFDGVRQNASDTWNNLLSKIDVQGGTEVNRKKFYTNLYRSYCARTTWSDVNGEYRDPCETVQKLADPASPMFGSDAFWNTFWNLNQLWTLVNPGIANQWVKSELEMYKHGGWLSRGAAGIEYSGIMVASHEIPLMVSAYQKGIRNYDTNLMYEAIIHQQTVQGIRHPCGGNAGNEQLDTYIKLGYMPEDSGATSNTLEYAYDDWCVSQFAKAMGKTDVYQTFTKRAKNYQNIFDPETKFMRPKHANGKWEEKFDAMSSPGYVEGNAWQYSFFVPHNMRDLISLVGKEKFNQRLNDGFEKSVDANFNATGDRMEDYYINHGNQPNMQAAYLFNYSGKPWLTQKWVREIQNRYYGSDPYNAWLGDEDEGQMGAWYVMSAIGLFETDGGASVKPFYEIGSPLFTNITIHLDPKYYPGKTFMIEAKNASDKNKYIQSASFNGKMLNKPWFYHDELVKGGKLLLIMGDKPNEKWGSEAGAAPPSMPEN
ncbi:MAG: GH92 family glycosyl hydrolase [Ferruginibacter sp.]